jgi:PII-like signaling protein
MSLATRLKDRFAKRLARFVEKERARVGCAKTAMANVGRKLGMSTVAVYRAMNGYGGKIQAHHHAALIMHSVGIVKAAASRMKTRRHATSIHA